MTTRITRTKQQLSFHRSLNLFAHKKVKKGLYKTAAVCYDDSRLGALPQQPALRLLGTGRVQHAAFHQP